MAEDKRHQTQTLWGVITRGVLGGAPPDALGMDPASSQVLFALAQAPVTGSRTSGLQMATHTHTLTNTRVQLTLNFRSTADGLLVLKGPTNVQDTSDESSAFFRLTGLRTEQGHRASGLEKVSQSR